MTLNELNAAIIKWADDREITKHSTPYAQAFKTAEEVQELIEAGIVYRWDQSDSRLDSVKDAIGDIYVTLIVGASCTGLRREVFIVPTEPCESVRHKDPISCVQANLVCIARSAPAVRRDTHPNIRGYFASLDDMMGALVRVAEQYGTTLEACVEQAYNMIKDRKGKLLPNGIFVKEES